MAHINATTLFRTVTKPTSKRSGLGTSGSSLFKSEVTQMNSNSGSNRISSANQPRADVLVVGIKRDGRES